jgi:galactokinase
VEFDPVQISYIPVPRDWTFLIAHSGVSAEKSGPAREEYNARRKAGSTALATLGLHSYAEARVEMAAVLPTERERDAYMHTVTEASRVCAAVDAVRQADAARFGRLLLESHASLRERLRVSCPELDRLVDAAMTAGAHGARLTGAGFGGCAVVFCTAAQADAVRAALPSPLVLEARPSAGALFETT